MNNKFRIPSEFSVPNGYIAFVIGQWLKEKAGYILDGNLAIDQLEARNEFFTTYDLVICIRGSRASWQTDKRRTPLHFGHLADFIKYVKTPEISVRLNSEYAATFAPGDNMVTVGCQKIPTIAILELADKLRGNQ